MNEPTWQQKIAAILAAGWTRRQVYEGCGIAKNTFSDLEHGKSEEPLGMAAVHINDLYQVAKRRKKP